MKAFLVAMFMLFAVPAFAAGGVVPLPATQPPAFVPNDQPTEVAPSDMESLMKMFMDDDDKSPVLTLECNTHPCVQSYRFSDSVDDDSAAKFEKFMTAAKLAHADMVVVEMNTPGGSMSDGHEISRQIEGAPFPVVCVVDGTSASMGMYILESCSTRVMTKRSQLMIHQVHLTVGRGARLTDVIIDNARSTIQVATRAYVEWVTHRMKVAPGEVLRKINGGREWWLDWEEALKTGAVDKVIGQTPDEYLKELRKSGTP